MSGQLPISPGFRSFVLDSAFSGASDFAQSGKKNSRQFGGHLWLIKAIYPISDQSNFMPLWAFIQQQEGGFETFFVRLPDKDTPQGVGGGSPLVNGSSQTGKTLIIDGGTASATGWLKAGDIFSVAGNAKVHALTEDANTGAGGAVTLNFIPALRVSPADNAVIKINNVEFSMSFLNYSQDYNVELPFLYNVSIDMIESL